MLMNKSRIDTLRMGVVLVCGWLCMPLPGAQAGEWPQTDALSDIVYAAGRFVAVGGQGNLVWSIDGQTWAKGGPASAREFVDVLHTGSRFVALDRDGTLMQSTDGTAWTLLGSATIEGYATGLAYNGTTYVMVDDFGYIYASSNGTAWTVEFEPAASADEELYAVTYGNGKFVAVGIHYNADYDSYGLIRVSSTGLSWTRERQKLNEELYGVDYVNGEFVATGLRLDADWNSFSQVLTSTAGTTWTQDTVPGEDTLCGAAYGNGVLAAVGDFGAIAVQVNGLWSQRWTGTNGMAAVAYGSGRFVAVGEGGVAAWSADGKAWVFPPAGLEENYSAIAAGAAAVLAGDLSGTLWIEEGDGVWGNTFSDYMAEIKQVGYGAGAYVAVGVYYDEEFDSHGLILRSQDGRSWEVARYSSAGEELYGVGFGGGQFVAVGYRESGDSSYDQILTSPDGRAWTQQAANTGADALGLSAAAYGAGRWVAVGALGTLVTSANGTAWTQVEIESAEDLNDVVYGQSQFVAVGSGGAVLVSANGQNWQERSVGQNRLLFAAAFGGNTCYCVGADGFIARSADCSTWVPIPSGVEADLRDALVRNEQIVVVGDASTILSIPLSPPEPAQLSVRWVAHPTTPIVLTLQGQPGSTHRLERSDSVGTNAAWSAVQVAEIGANGTATLSVAADGSRKFFRCAAQ